MISGACCTAVAGLDPADWPTPLRRETLARALLGASVAGAQHAVNKPAAAGAKRPAPDAGCLVDAAGAGPPADAAFLADAAPLADAAGPSKPVAASGGTMRRQERVGRVSNAPVPDSEACVATRRAVPSFTAFGEERVVASAPAGPPAAAAAGIAPPEGAVAAATARSAPELAAPSGCSAQAASWPNPSRAKRARPEAAVLDQDTAPGAFGGGATDGVLPPHPKKRRSGKRKPAAPQHPHGPAAPQPQAAAPRSGAGRQHALPCALCTTWQVHRLPARALLKSRRPPYLRSTRPHCYWLDREWGDARPENKGQVHKQQVRGWWWLWAHGS